MILRVRLQTRALRMRRNRSIDLEREGEGSPAFLPDGSLLFVSKRPEPAAGHDSGCGSPR